MSMSPFFKGVLGFLGCAAVSALVYHIGKNAGREETLREIEEEERAAAVPIPVQAVTVPETTDVQQDNVENTAPIIVQPANQPTPVEKVRKMHGLKNKILGGGGIIKDLLQNPDNKKVVITVDDGDIVARISPR